MLIKFDNFLIRKLTIQDASIDYLRWFKDPEIKKYIVNKNYSNLNELKKFLIYHTKNKNEIFLGIFLKNGNHVGNIKFEKINLKKKNCLCRYSYWREEMAWKKFGNKSIVFEHRVGIQQTFNKSFFSRG